MSLNCCFLVFFYYLFCYYFFIITLSISVLQKVDNLQIIYRLKTCKHNGPNISENMKVTEKYISDKSCIV